MPKTSRKLRALGFADPASIEAKLGLRAKRLARREPLPAVKDHPFPPTEVGPTIERSSPPGREWPEIPCGWLDRSQWSPGAI